MKTGVSAIVILAASLLLACNDRQSAMEGSWVTPVPGKEGQVQGFTLQKDGKAASINMATLEYEHWSFDGNNGLILSGRSIGNHQTIPFSDTLTVVKLTPEVLTLRRGDLTMEYSRVDAK